ncbi:MAG: ribosome maturation factor RimP [Candidatus Hydrogenedentes bacterium]|nr:ribosome maturation factor RimP [Candidatus Hydrogenedentota bacterium]
MDTRELVRRAWREIEPHLLEQGFELVELEFAGQGGRGILRLYVDREGGVTLDDCVAVSQVLGPVLDAAEFLTDSYVLEVSSPGVDRPVRKPEDFERFAGERVTLKSAMPVDGRKKFKGVIRGVVDGAVSVECDGQVYAIAFENVQRANLDR